MVAFTAHFYSLSPVQVAAWKPGEIVRWYRAAWETRERLMDEEHGKFFGILAKFFG